MKGSIYDDVTGLQSTTLLKIEFFETNEQMILPVFGSTQ